jgi:hypothetical protein
MGPRTVQGPNHVHCRQHFPRREGVGALFIVGGAGTPRLIHEELFRLAGGRESSAEESPGNGRRKRRIPRAGPGRAPIKSLK